MKIPFFFIVFILSFNIFYAQTSKIINEHAYKLDALFIGGKKNTPTIGSCEDIIAAYCKRKNIIICQTRIDQFPA